ncbi:hypothetical protein MHH70_02515 [Metasolibacillus sp. FSL H7-0170]|uniref:hypothetical protein n=1 Tax=Metasolibacillus sp. FSL H7-0170 TaxID=2921431 RepID=UPI00315960DD
MLLVKNEELCNLLYTVTYSAFEKINSYMRNEKIYYLPRYYKWPKRSLNFNNGLPSFSEDSYSEERPVKYKDFFARWQGNPRIEITDLNGYKEYEKYAMENQYFKEKYLLTPNGEDNSLFSISIKSIVESLVERYFHMYDCNENFDFDKFKKIYIPIENSIFNEILHIEIVVPLLFVKFDFESLEIDENTYIEQMDEVMQLSRTRISNYAVPVNETVINATTHALVLKNYSFKNTSKWGVSELLSQKNAYPLDIIDTFINCLRISLGLETGYGQLISRPYDWCNSYDANLRPIYGTLIRAFPSKFDRFYWLNTEIPTVTIEQMQSVGDMFLKIQKEPNSKMIIATQRLKYCYLRDNEQDAIIDAMIALETLLSDGEKSELNHKLALRMAALLPLSKEVTQTPIEIFTTVKKIYDYRSAIVHGNPKANNKREIKFEGVEPIPAVERAIEYLRLAISIMIENPQYLKANKIDEELLLKSFQ